MKNSKRTQKDRSSLASVLMVSAWGVIIVISSFLFMYVGRWIDVNFNTEPTFMIGMLFLGICLCMFRLYKDVSYRSSKLHRQDKAA